MIFPGEAADPGGLYAGFSYISPGHVGFDTIIMRCGTIRKHSADRLRKFRGKTALSRYPGDLADGYQPYRSVRQVAFDNLSKLCYNGRNQNYK